MTTTVSRRTVDGKTASWLRERNPRWSEARVRQQLARSYVTDEHPNWTLDEVDREVARQLGKGPEKTVAAMKEEEEEGKP